MEPALNATPAAAVPLVALLVVAAWTDLQRRVVPNRLLAAGAAWALAVTAIHEPGELADRTGAGALAFAVLLSIALAARGSLGMGDVKLTGVIGLYLGPAVAAALAAAFAAGSLAGAALLAREGLAARKRALPFAPFLALGGLVGLLFGDELMRLYAGQLR